MKPTELSPAALNYIQCALWASTDDEGTPLDTNWSINDFSAETLENISREVDAFTAEFQPDLEASSLDESQIGHDLFLTRNRHGAGFWDRFNDNSKEGKACRRLTEEAHALGSSNIYVGDNGQLYFS